MGPGRLPRTDGAPAARAGGSGEDGGFATFTEAWASAADALPGATTTLWHAIGGRPVAVRAAGDGLAAPLARSMVPCAPAPDPALRLDLWSVEASGVGPPDGAAFPGVAERHGGAGERFTVTADRRTIRHHGPGFDIRFRRDERHAVGWVRAVTALSAWHRARPLQTLLLPWLTDLGMVVVHAAMVARDGAGVLVAGPSGRGKSTTSAACAAAGMSVLGDDAIAVERDDAGWAGHCLHAAVKLRTPLHGGHTGLAARAEPCGPPWEGEAVLYLPEAAPGAMAASARLVAVALPELSGATATTLTPVSSGRCLAGLTGAALSLEPGGVAEGFGLLAGLATEVPAFRISVGQDPAGIPKALDALIARLRG